MGKSKGVLNKPKPHAVYLNRLLSRCKVEGECLVYQGANCGNGYGRMGYDRTYEAVHRLVLILNGYEIGDWHVLHHCDNRKCVNVAHLFLGTNRDNAVDCSIKRRNAMQRRTTCPKGHSYTAENTLVNSRGSRVCRECDRLKKNKGPRQRYHKGHLMIIDSGISPVVCNDTARRYSRT